MRFTYLFIDLQNTIFSSMVQQILVGQGLLIIEASQSHTGTQTTVGRIPLDEWSATPKGNTPDNKQHSQQTDIHVHGGIKNPKSQQVSSRRPTY
jgi:hypothetical protein